MTFKMKSQASQNTRCFRATELLSGTYIHKEGSQYPPDHKHKLLLKVTGNRINPK